MGIVYSMALREIKRFWRSKARVISSLAQPLLFLVALGFGFGPIFQKAGGGNYIEFLAPGIIGMTILFSSMFMGIQVIWDRQFGFLQETLVAPVSRYKIMLGRTLGGATIASVQGLIVFLISMLIGFTPQNILLIPFALIFMFLIAILFTALGTAIASRLQDMHAFQLITNFLTMPLFFLSGALFPVDTLPNAIQIIIKINPLYYGVQALRTSLTSVSQINLLPDFLVLGTAALLMTLLGSYLFSKIEM